MGLKPMTMHAVAPVDSGDGKLLPVGGNVLRLNRLAAELKAAYHIANNDKDESKEADRWHHHRIDSIEKVILNTPLKTLADVKAAIDILSMDILSSDGEPEWDDSFITRLCIKITRAVKKLPGE